MSEPESSTARKRGNLILVPLIAVLCGLAVHYYFFFKNMYDTDRLIAAIEVGDHETVERLLLKGVDPNTMRGAELDGASRVPLLGLAIERGDARTVAMLLDHGANQEQETVLGFNAMQAALILQDDDEIVELLVKHGADVNAALPLACKEGRHEAVKLLFDAGASVIDAADGWWRGEIAGGGSPPNASLMMLAGGNEKVVELIVTRALEEYRELDGMLPLEPEVSAEKIQHALMEYKFDAPVHLARDGKYGWALFLMFFLSGADDQSNDVFADVLYPHMVYDARELQVLFQARFPDYLSGSHETRAKLTPRRVPQDG